MDRAARLAAKGSPLLGKKGDPFAEELVLHSNDGQVGVLIELTAKLRTVAATKLLKLWWITFYVGSIWY